MQVTKSDADWGNNMQNLSEFATVEDFWKVYNNVPKPSQVGQCAGGGGEERRKLHLYVGNYLATW